MNADHSEPSKMDDYDEDGDRPFEGLGQEAAVGAEPSTEEPDADESPVHSTPQQ